MIEDEFDKIVGRPVVEEGEPIFDLASLDTVAGSDNGAEIAIVHPITKEPVGIYWTVLGKHSQVFRDIVKERVDRRIKAEAAAAQKGKPLIPKTAEQAEQEAIELLAACSLGWRQEHNSASKDTITYKKEELIFNIPNALRILREMLWIREQVDEAIGDLENFIKA